METAQAGWYPDPSGDATKLRYWDGERWTDDYADAQPNAQAASQPTPAPQQPSAAQSVATPTYYPQAQPVANDSDRGLRLAAFILCILSTVAVCWLIAYALAKPLVALALAGWEQNLQENLAMVAGMCLYTGLNYLGQRFFAFKQREKE